MSKNRFIWIFGENHGATADNNSYFFWKEAVNIKDDIEKYIVFQKTDKTLKQYEKFSKHEKEHILWKNSRKHFKLFLNADMFFVTLSYKDVLPNKFLFKNVKYIMKQPVVYLRHGTTGMKRTYYEGTSYWNNLFRFLAYNPEEPDYLVKYNNFKRYQVYYCDFHPRYGEFVRKDEYYSDKNQILWFLTWREYFGENLETKIFKQSITNVLKSNELKQYLTENNLKLKLCVHQFFDKKTFKEIYKNSKEGLIEIAHSSDVNVMDELVKSKILITDYSSVAYDFTFLDRPVLLYQPDLEVYNKTREFFCDIDDLNRYNIKNPQDLIDDLISGNYDVNPFFRKTYPEQIDYDFIKEDKHIDKMYDYFAEIQRKKITILGLNFYEHTAAVNSTLSFAEMLLHNNYMVEAISLYREKRRFNAPNALNMKSLYWPDEISFKEKIFNKIFSLYGYGNLKYDSKKSLFSPYAVYRLNKLMKNINSDKVISTRESLHLLLNQCSSDYVNDKIYFFQNPIDYNKKGYEELLDKIKDINIKKSVFVSERDVEFFKNNLNLKIPSSKFIYESFIVENQILDLDLNSDFLDENYKLKDIYIDPDDEELMNEYMLLSNLINEKKDLYTGLCILDIEKYNLDDLNNIIAFGKYLKENHIENINIDVIGKGDYSLKFIDLIAENDLFDYINFLGNNLNRITEIRRHDFILDLSKNPNHNTVYLQGVLNYKKVFCLKNDKSFKLLNDIPDTFIESYEWLCNQIDNLHQISLKDLDDYFNIVYNKHFEIEFSNNLIDYVETD